MPELPRGKTYIPTGTLMLARLCDFVTKHSATIIAVTAVVAPEMSAEVNTALTAIQTSCVVFKRLLHIVDPNNPLGG